MREQNQLLKDIVDAINSITIFTKDINYEEFCKDDKTISAVIRNFEVMGEASKHLSDKFKKDNPEIPFKEMAGMRDRLIHDYFGVDVNLVWETIQNYLPPIKTKLLDFIE